MNTDCTEVKKGQLVLRSEAPLRRVVRGKGTEAQRHRARSKKDKWTLISLITQRIKKNTDCRKEFGHGFHR